MMNSVTAAVVILFSVYAGSASASTGIQGDEEHGRYLATLGDCAACHSPSGAASYSGGLQIDTPVGAIFSTNITPDKQTGIGTYSYAGKDHEKYIFRTKICAFFVHERCSKVM